MATEAEYDEHIAPMLAAVEARARSLGMNLVARVEWEPGHAGITHTGVTDDISPAQTVACLAALCNGNVDLLCIEIAKRMNCDASLVLRSLQQKD